jgi:thymidylate kinase
VNGSKSAFMIQTKLIFVEGLPGTGKSTTASWVAERLKTEQRRTRLFLEHQPAHPLNVGGDSHPAGETPGEEFFQRYTPELFIHESLNRWQRFGHQAEQEQVVYVLDSYPFQNSIRVLLQLDADYESMKAYARQVESMVMPLQPALVYFSRRDTQDAIQQFVSISAQRGTAWTNYVVELLMHCPYAQNRNLEGLDGVLTFMSDYHQWVNLLLSESHLPRLVLENCPHDWECCYRRIEAFLEIS